MKTEHTPTQKWTIKKSSTRYPDLFEYTILEPNPDAGKQGVCYSGSDFAVCTLDDEDAANRIVLAVNHFEELKDALKALLASHAPTINGLCKICKHYGDDCEAHNARAVLSAIEQEQNR